jgi:para-nitrobenzyl esterase
MKRLGLTALVGALCFAGHFAEAAMNDPVTTEGGLVEGTGADGLMVYKGIPFAAPPVGDMRFKAPAPVKPWTGVKATKEFAASCMQNKSGIPMLGLPELTVSEDCLYLNIWTPAKSAGEKLPVMVWIYGGGFTMGSTSYPLYDGANLAKKGVILVSVNYRVGPFGFLAHPALSADSPHHVSGNYGLLDQIAGLKWVKDNIAAFGGDPDRVTIFGESAGGISVSMLAASPLAKGLFAGAISESGGSFGPTGSRTAAGENVQILSSAEKDGEAFADKLGAKTVADLRKLPADDIQKASEDRQQNVGWPVADGYVIPADQYKLYLAGRYNDVPVLIGTNDDEGALFVFKSDKADYVKSTEERYGPFAKSILKAYPATDDATALQSARDLARDTIFGWHTWVWAQLQAKTGKSKVFMYYFDHKPPQAPNSPMKTRSASHGAEMVYVFDNLDGPVPYTDDDRAVADAMSTYWTNFAKTGNPNGPGVPEWPVFTGAKPAVMHVKDKPMAGPVPNLPQLQAVDAYMAWRRGQESAAKP